MKYNIFLLLAGLASMIMPACSRISGETPEGVQENAIYIRTSGYQSESAPSQAQGEDDITEINAYLFSEGVLSGIYENLEKDSSGKLDLDLTGLSGNLYLLANGAGSVDLEWIEKGNTAEDEFLQESVSVTEEGNAPHIMSAGVTLSDRSSVRKVTLERGVARVDLDFSVAGIELESMTISGLASSGRVFRHDGKYISPDSKEIEISSLPQESKAGIAYIYEQYDSEIIFEIRLKIDGVNSVRRAVLTSDIGRGKVYTLRISDKGAGAEVEIVADDRWEDGDDTGAGAESAVLIDTERTELPAGVRVSESKDTLFISHMAAEVSLFTAGEYHDYVLSGNVPGAGISRFSLSRASDRTLHITSGFRTPEIDKGFVYVDFKDEDGIMTGRITIVFEPHPVRFKGLAFNNSMSIDYGTYVDGVLGRILLPEGVSVSLDIPEGTDPWVRIAEDSLSSGWLVVEGGWRPNDPEADGREQVARIVLEYDDPSFPDETYTLRRENWGLPVVQIGDTWWTLYNLRGNVRSFEDQITVDKDPAAAAGKTLSDYLATCSEDELLYAMGHQYLGGRQDGMSLAHDGSHFYYDGYSASGNIQIGTTDPFQMAPSGYKLPEGNDYRALAFGTNCNFGSSSGVYNSGLGLRFRFNITDREVEFMGHSYGTVSFYDLNVEGIDRHLVLYGLGHQWEAASGSVSPGYILFGSHTGNSQTWSLLPENGTKYFRLSDNNPNKTRTLRAVKIPVDYIY